MSAVPKKRKQNRVSASASLRSLAASRRLEPDSGLEPYRLCLNQSLALAFCLSTIFSEKPVPTFRDHALSGLDLGQRLGLGDARRPPHGEAFVEHRIIVIAAAGDRLHGGGVEQAVLDEALVDMHADD